MPKISIILPTYNGSKYISKAIKSVIDQTFKDWELIIINDASTDNTEQTIKNASQNDRRIVYIKNDQNLRLQKTLNKGLSLAKGEYAARIDDDDVWTDAKKLETQVSFLDSNPEHLLVGTQFKTVDEDGKTIRELKLPTSDEDIRKAILSYNPFCHSTVMFRKKEILGLGGYSEDKRSLHMEDYDLWLKVGAIGKFANLDMVTTDYLQKKGGLASQARKLNLLKFHIRALKKYWNVYNGKMLALFRMAKTLISAILK